MEKKRVILAEDDFDFGSILKQYLEIHNFDVTWCEDGEAAYENIRQSKSPANLCFDICVFDVMMPKLDGFALAEKVVDFAPELPFIFLTAKKMKEDRIRGLKLGADDYIQKPFEADILVLRLQNILKRSGSLSTQAIVAKSAFGPSAIGAYEFNPTKRLLIFRDKEQSLTEKEVHLIQFFLSKKNELVSREELLTAVWGNDDYFSGRSMDVFISRLRKYFKDDASISIESKRGLGLTFSC